jgi:hypothetical protein
MRNTPTLQNSNTPSLHHSITPTLRVTGFEDDDEDENENEAPRDEIGQLREGPDYL